MSNDRPISVLVVDDHTIFRQGVIHFLSETEGIEVIGEASSIRESKRLIQQAQPDVILLDISLGEEDGVAAIPELLAKHPEGRILMLSMHFEKELVDQAFAHGAQGFVLKNDAFEDLIYAMKSVYAGGRYVSPRLLAEETPEAFFGQSQSHGPRITPREKEVLLLVAEGNTAAEIAEQRFISRKTVETHRARMATKYGLRTALDCLRHAIRAGWIDP